MTPGVVEEKRGQYHGVVWDSDHDRSAGIVVLLGPPIRLRLFADVGLLDLVLGTVDRCTHRTRRPVADLQLSPPELGADGDIRGNGMPSTLHSTHPFTCRQGLTTSDHAEWFRCRLQYRQSETKLITIVDMNARTTSTALATHGTNVHLHALAVVYQTPVRINNHH
ncbi:hypothetical protein PG994_013475 [Apiospora phragmitis]|uniref:Uncharacterized protein n=1 Tax=Apiospora phragmitis TaxID=2905665 RepID=A0ABR1T8Q4_9PEZI